MRDKNPIRDFHDHRRPIRDFLDDYRLQIVVGMIVFGGLFLFVWMEQADIRPTVDRTDCGNRMRDLIYALHEYEIEFGALPPAVVRNDRGAPMHSWRVLILPFMDNPVLQAIYNEYEFEQPWNSPHNTAVAKKMPAEVFQCPTTYRNQSRAERRQTFTSYVLLTGEKTLFDDQTRTSADVQDGPTIVLIEYAESNLHWSEPGDMDREVFLELFADSRAKAKQAGIREKVSCQLSEHGAGINVCLYDGLVDNLARKVSATTLDGLTTIAGGERVIDF